MGITTVGPLTGSARAQTDTLLMARVLGTNGALLNQASVSSITYLVTDTTTGLPTGNGTFPVATTVFNSLVQSDARWSQDSIYYPGPDQNYGYNFAATIPAALIPNSVRYQVDVVFLTTSGGQFIVSWSFLPAKVYA